MSKNFNTGGKEADSTATAVHKNVRISSLSPTRKTVSPPRMSPYDLERVLETDLIETERKLRVAQINKQRVKGITGVASEFVHRLEKECEESRCRLEKVRASEGDPGFRYNLGQAPPNVVKAHIIVECCRPSTFVHDSRLGKYEEVFAKLDEQVNIMLLSVPLRKNEEEDMMTIPRPDRFHLPRVGAFEIYLQYFQKPERPPRPQAQEEEEVKEKLKAENTKVPLPGERPKDKSVPPKEPNKKKEEVLIPNLVRLFSKLQTKKWPSVAKVANAVRLFLPLHFDKLAAEAEAARIAGINARKEAAQASVSAAMAECDASQAKAEEHGVKLAEVQGHFQTATTAFNKVSEEKKTFENAVKASNKNLKAMEGEMKQAGRDFQSADDEMNAAEPVSKAAKKVVADKAKTICDRAESAVNTAKRDQKNAQADLLDIMEKYQEIKKSYDEANNEMQEAQAELDVALHEINSAEEMVTNAKVEQQNLLQELEESV